MREIHTFKSLKNLVRIESAIGMLLDINATTTKESTMSDPTNTSTPEVPAEPVATPTTEKHLSLAKEIEKFAGEVEADVGEAWEAFKAFVLAKIDPSAKAGDPVVVTPPVETPPTPTPAAS